MPEVTLTAYTVDACGYFNRRGTRAAYSLSALISDITRLANAPGATLLSTKTFERDQDAGVLPVYCYAAVHSGSRGETRSPFLLSTWNETPDNESGAGAVSLAGPVGRTAATDLNYPEDSTPGYATHFLISPADNTIITVQRESQMWTGMPELRRYIMGFLSRFSPHVVFDDPTDDGQGEDTQLTMHIAGYSREPRSGDPDPSLQPRFRVRRAHSATQIEGLRRNVGRITRVVKKGRPMSVAPRQRRLLDRWLQSMGGSEHARAVPQRGFSLSVPYRPSLEELDAMIAAHEHAGSSNWNDTGFGMKSSSQIFWLSGAVRREKVTIEDIPSDQEPNDYARQLLRLLRPHLGTLTE